MIKLAVVIPAFRGREQNLHFVLDSLENQSLPIDKILIVDDGGELHLQDGERNCQIIRTEKHIPGLEQPRNIGARMAKKIWPDITHLWFIDSDVVIAPESHKAIQDAYKKGSRKRILICPYEWLPEGLRPSSKNDFERFFSEARQVETDFRWIGFHRHDVYEQINNDLSSGLACFTGNLVWNYREFIRVGGFWNEIHHGRCEDGELGLRAVVMDVPISWCAGARGFHLFHPINTSLLEERNARDVPMLNERHPWVEQGGVFMVDRDGKAFDCRCSECGEVVNTILWWKHSENCQVKNILIEFPS